MRSILWHVKAIEFHKEICSLIRLFILMQSSGLNLSLVYNSLRHVLSLPSFPRSPSPPSSAHTHPPLLPCQIPWVRRRQRLILLVISRIHHLSLLTQLIPVYLCMLSPTKTSTGAMRQFVIFTSAKQDIALIQCTTLDLEGALTLCSCCRWTETPRCRFQPALMLHTGP